MQQIGRKVFSYPAWRPWPRLPAVIILAVILILYLTFLSREQIAYWLLLVGLVALVILSIRRFALAFIEPNIIIVTDDGIAGRPLRGPTVQIDWPEVYSAKVSAAKDSLLGRRTDIMRIRARDGQKVIVFDSDLPGYDELREIVLWHTEIRGMQYSGCQVFSHSAWRPWSRLPVVIFCAAIIILELAVIYFSSDQAVQIAGWLGFTVVLTLLVLFAYLFARTFIEANVVIVTDDGITAKRLRGATQHISWADVASVHEDTMKDYKGSFRRRADILHVLARDGRTVIEFDSDLPGYRKLREIVLWHTESGKKQH